MTAEPAAPGGFRLSSQVYDPAIPVEGIREHPRNYNEGDMDAIGESLDEHGWLGALYVQKSTGMIIGGNHSYRAALSKGADTLPGFWLDVDDDEAERIMVMLNYVGRLSRFNPDRLAAILQPMSEGPRGLAGTGVSEDALAALVARLQPPGEFTPYDDDLPTTYRCPACGYEWSGKPVTEGGPPDATS